MKGSPSPSAHPHPELRQKTLDALCEAFADDRLAMEEFERRVDRVHSAATVADLQSLLTDLPASLPERHSESGPGPARAPATGRERPLLPPDRVREHSLALAVLGGTQRAGSWSPARKNWVLSVCGGAVLDFREAEMPRGTTDLRLLACCGGIDVIVPPDLRVECSGSGILGGFDSKTVIPSPNDPAAPLLRVWGLAVMGGINVSVRHPGESAGDARRRRKLERKAQQRLARGRPDG